MLTTPGGEAGLRTISSPKPQCRERRLFRRLQPRRCSPAQRRGGQGFPRRPSAAGSSTGMICATTADRFAQRVGVELRATRRVGQPRSESCLALNLRRPAGHVAERDLRRAARRPRAARRSAAWPVVERFEVGKLFEGSRSSRSASFQIKLAALARRHRTATGRSRTARRALAFTARVDVDLCRLPPLARFSWPLAGS